MRVPRPRTTIPRFKRQRPQSCLQHPSAANYSALGGVAHQWPELRRAHSMAHRSIRTAETSPLILGRLFHRRLAMSRPGCRQIGKEVVGKLVSASNRTARGIAACQPFAIRRTLHCAFVVAGGAIFDPGCNRVLVLQILSRRLCNQVRGRQALLDNLRSPLSIQVRMPGSSHFRTPEERYCRHCAKQMACSYHNRI